MKITEIEARLGPKYGAPQISDVCYTLSCLRSFNSAIMFYDLDEHTDPIFGDIGSASLIFTRTLTDDSGREWRSWAVATDAYLFSQDVGWTVPNRLMMGLRYDHLDCAYGEPLLALNPDKAVWLNGFGIPYQFAGSSCWKGHTRHGPDHIEWGEPEAVCALRFNSEEHHALARLGF